MPIQLEPDHHGAALRPRPSFSWAVVRIAEFRKIDLAKRTAASTWLSNRPRDRATIAPYCMTGKLDVVLR